VKTSIYSLAEMAGVSPMTVSRALRPGTPVAKATRKLVQDLARKHGHTHDPVAVALRSGSTLEVAVSYETLTRGEFSAVVGELNLRLTKIGYYTKVLAPHPMPLSVRDIKQLLPQRPQGLLLINLASEAVVDWLQQNEIPTVWLIERPPVADGRVVFFGSEDYSGTRQILEHLYAWGHRRIAHLCAKEHTFGAVQREKAYHDFMREHGLPETIEPTTFDAPGGAASTSLLMARTPRPTAILCSNDINAAGAMFRLNELGIRVPADISVVGFGDIPGTHYEYFYPGLTTVRHPYRELAIKAADALVDYMLGGDTQQGNVLLPTELVIRGSCGPVKSRCGG